MKILRLLNRRYLPILLIFFIHNINLYSQEPVDIWNIEKKDSKKKIELEKNSNENVNKKKNSIYKMQSSNKENNIELDNTLISKEVQIIGLYDPEENGLNINMWSNSDGDQIVNIFNNLKKIELSDDASEIMNTVLLTNAYYPEKNISKEKFLKIKSDWLIKNSNLELIENYLISNQIVNENIELMRYLVDEYLSRSNLEKSCEIFDKINHSLSDEYLSKFKIYCLVNNNKSDEAQLNLDLKKETGFKDIFFEDKINFLLGFNKKVDTTISEENILNFHLSHRTNPEFSFEPKKNTSKLIWKYLSSSNLLTKANEISIEDIDRISIIEKATHDKNYPEDELFKLYRNFQFNIDQLLNIPDTYKLLSNIEGRALIYQGILITTDVAKKIKLMKLLKDSLIKEGIEKAFDDQLEKFLIEIDIDTIPSNLTSFYLINVDNINENFNRNIKINNKILHQSKLVNYFRDDYQNKNIKKDLNDFLSKIKKNKKYFFSKKDIMLVESLKADGIEIQKKFSTLYEINENEMPTDIQVLINNEDLGGALLRIIEVIGQDKIKDIDDDTMYFIISTLNQLNVDPIRNKLLIKVLPLKV